MTPPPPSPHLAIQVGADGTYLYIMVPKGSFYNAAKAPTVEPITPEIFKISGGHYIVPGTRHKEVICLCSNNERSHQEI
jgi:hypothetical protein